MCGELEEGIANCELLDFGMLLKDELGKGH